MYTTIFSNGNIESLYYSGNELGGGTYSCNALAQKYIDRFWELNKDTSEDDASEQKKESPDERQYDSSEEDDEEHDFCSEIDNKGYIDALTFTGGTLYGAGIWDNQGCSGVHILDAFDTTTQLVKTPPHFPKQESTPQHCQKREWDSVPWPFDPEVPMVDFANEDEGEVYSCENTEATIYQLRNGHLIEVQIGADAIGGACACELMTPLSPQNCPSLADPCGDPQPFSQALESWPEFWIANDGSAALVRNETGFGILLPKQTKSHPINFTINEDLSLLGVRFHQDIRPLLRSIKSRNQTPKLIRNRCSLTSNSVIASTAKLAEDDKGYEDPHHGRGWGNRCFSHFKAGRLSEAQAACERGLQLAEDSSVRGALFYNLGRISQTRGDLERAVEFYTVSLQLRPNQPSVQNQLEQAKKQVNPATSSYP